MKGMVSLNGSTLTVEQTGRVSLANEEVELTADSVGRMRRSRAVVERLASGDEPVYGVNTGVGLLADVRIPPEDLDQLAAQRRPLPRGGRGRSAGARRSARA